MSALEFMLRHWREILSLAGEHLLLVLASTLIAVGVGIPGLVDPDRGAVVHAVCSGRNKKLVGSLGADRVFDYTAEDFTTSGEVPPSSLSAPRCEASSGERRATRASEPGSNVPCWSRRSSASRRLTDAGVP